MKNILAAIFTVCFAFSVKAQLPTDLLHNRLNDKLPVLKLDTSTCKLIAPKLPGTLYNNFNLLKGGNLPVANMPGFADAKIVYSRMPVMPVQSGDNMPIAHINAAGLDISVKRVLVIDPLSAK